MRLHRQVAEGEQNDVAWRHGHGPRTVAIVWIHPWVARAGDYAVVTTFKVPSTN